MTHLAALRGKALRQRWGVTPRAYVFHYSCASWCSAFMWWGLSCVNFSPLLCAQSNKSQWCSGGGSKAFRPGLSPRGAAILQLWFCCVEWTRPESLRKLERRAPSVLIICGGKANTRTCEEGNDGPGRSEALARRGQCEIKALQWSVQWASDCGTTTDPLLCQCSPTDTPVMPVHAPCSEGESCPRRFLHPLVAAEPHRPDNDGVCGLMKQENYLNGVLVNGRWQSASLVRLLECSLATVIQLMVYYFSVDSIQELSTGSGDVTDGMQPRPSVAVSYVWEDLIIQHNLILQWGTLLRLKPPSVICYHLCDYPILGWSRLTAQEIKACF